jgi:hypothetical protein
MCFGAIPWSGRRRLVSGARSSDAEDIGFDEGPKRRVGGKSLNSAEYKLFATCIAIKVLVEYSRRCVQALA